MNLDLSHLEKFMKQENKLIVACNKLDKMKDAPMSELIKQKEIVIKLTNEMNAMKEKLKRG